MRNKRFNERGVELVELALIMPLLILLCFGVVDLLRLSYFESMLQRVAADIAVQARTAPNLDYDLRDFTSNSGEFVDYTQSKQRAILAGLTHTLNSFSQPGVPSDAMLIAASQVDDSLGNYSAPTPAPFVSNAVILRPGEQATFSYVNSSGVTVNDIVRHPMIRPDAAGRVPPQKMDALLELAPIHIEVRAVVQPLLYFVLGTKVLRGAATTYREKGIRRVIARNNTGADIAGPTATRRTGGPETWLASPEPMEPVSGVRGWLQAFQWSDTIDQMHCASIWPAPPTLCPSTRM